jgi:hypothetical protein
MDFPNLRDVIRRKLDDGPLMVWGPRRISNLT